MNNDEHNYIGSIHMHIEVTDELYPYITDAPEWNLSLYIIDANGAEYELFGGYDMNVALERALDSPNMYIDIEDDIEELYEELLDNDSSLAVIDSHDFTRLCWKAFSKTNAKIRAKYEDVDGEEYYSYHLVTGKDTVINVFYDSSTDTITYGKRKDRGTYILK